MIPAIQTNSLQAKSRLLATAKLTAMPRLVSDQDWPIADPEVNKATLVKLLDTATQVAVSDGNVLYRDGSPYDGSYFLVKEGFICYYMEYVVHAAHFEGTHSVTQTSVWRSLSPSVPRGLPAHVVFKYLVPKYPAVMSDRIQTERGRDFWIDLMAQALEKNLSVEIVPLTTRKVFPIKSQEELREWVATKSGAWGLQHEQIRFLIKRN